MNIIENNFKLEDLNEEGEYNLHFENGFSINVWFGRGLILMGTLEISPGKLIWGESEGNTIKFLYFNDLYILNLT